METEKPATQENAPATDGATEKTVPETKPEPTATPEKSAVSDAPVVPETPKAETEKFFSDAKEISMPKEISEAEQDFMSRSIGAIQKMAIDGKMTVKNVQAEVDKRLSMFKEVAAYGDSRLKAQVESWTNEIVADAKLGGNNLNKTSQLVERSLVSLFGKDFYESSLKDLYLLKHPEAVRGLAKFGESISDPELHLGDKPAPPAEKPLSLGQRVYGKDYNPLRVGNNSGAPKR
ncbi:MAG: hypothetical protein ACRDFB_03280 [Rhabdochlamydiaceae bacterium]